MILLGLIIVLLAIAAGMVLYFATQNLTAPVDLEAGGYQVGATPLALLIAGAVVMLLLWLGLALIRGSVRRKTRRRRESKEAQRQAENEERIREDERARMAESAATEQRFAGPGAAAAGAAGAASAVSGGGTSETARHSAGWRDDPVGGEPHDAPTQSYERPYAEDRPSYADSRGAGTEDRPSARVTDDSGAQEGYRTRPAARDERVYDQSTDRTQVLGNDAAVGRESPAGQPGGRHEAPADARDTDEEGSRRTGSEPTVADKIMGRERQ